MSRNIVGILGSAIVAIYIFGSGRLVTTDQQWYRSLTKPSWQPPSFVVGLIWPYNFALLIAASWIVASRLGARTEKSQKIRDIRFCLCLLHSNYLHTSKTECSSHKWTVHTCSH